MARSPRLVLPGMPHHVIHRGHNRQPIVGHDADRRAWVEVVRLLLERHPVQLHAYVLMDNHFHLLATPTDAQALSRFMQDLGRRYVGLFNAAHRRSGTLWEGRFKCAPVQAERYFMACMRYIELNPVRAGMVEQPQDHPWSSAAHHLGLRRDPLVVDHALYWALGNTPFDRHHHYRQLLDSGMPGSEVRSITDLTLKGRVLGTPRFVESCGESLGRPLTPKPRGRPRLDSVPI